MITRYRAWMDGDALDEIADSIYITDIVEPETQVEVISLPLAGRSGSRLQSNHRRSKTVLIQLMIREYDVKARKDVLNQVLTWAQGEELEINDRDGLVLYVRLDNVPQISSLKWTETLTLSFTAWDVPYWQNKSQLSMFKAGAEGNFLFDAGGNMPTVLDFEVRNAGDQVISVLLVSANDEYVVGFADLDLQPNETLLYSHDARGIVSAKIGTRSVIGKMLPHSHDDLYTAGNGGGHTNKVTFSASASVQFFLRMRWRWL